MFGVFCHFLATCNIKPDHPQLPAELELMFTITTRTVMSKQKNLQTFKKVQFVIILEDENTACEQRQEVRLPLLQSLS